MPAKDIYHDQVRNALEKENWQITKDPLVLKWGIRDLYIDLVRCRKTHSRRENWTKNSSRS